MEITQGWATEFGRDKFAVSVNDTDFIQICLDHGISEAYQAQITATVKFSVLDTFARYLSLREAVREWDADTPERAKAVQRSVDAKNAHLEVVRRVKVHLGLEAAPPAQEVAPQPV